VSFVRPQRSAAALAVLLAVVPGCSWVHDRQPLFPNRTGRLLDGRQAAREGAPKVDLRIDSSASTADGDAIETPASR
jgi:hypothetical protein